LTSLGMSWPVFAANQSCSVVALILLRPLIAQGDGQMQLNVKGFYSLLRAKRVIGTLKKLRRPSQRQKECTDSCRSASGDFASVDGKTSTEKCIKGASVKVETKLREAMSGVAFFVHSSAADQVYLKFDPFYQSTAFTFG